MFVKDLCKCVIFVSGDLGGKIEETHLRLQLANLSQCLLLRNALHVNPSLIQKDYRGERSYTR